MEGYRPSTYGESFADVYDEWYGQITDVGAMVEVLAAHVGTGRALELGVGTGRVAVPLAERGVDVVGVDVSPAMLDQLRERNTRADRTVLASRADMGALPFAGGSFHLVFAAYNTLFNLTSQLDLDRCLRDVGRVLTDEGVLVVESFVAASDLGSHGDVEVRAIELDRVVLTVSRVDATQQTISGQHIEIRESGIRMRPWLLRYATLDQLDDAAASNGFVLAARWADWQAGPFTPASDTHVTVYRRTRGTHPRPHDRLVESVA
jgi:ubiquinone/menaquinone biosynthesis C-methylase UbiE